jgi:transcriptional repressor NrdR
MQCPKCRSEDVRVIDTRGGADAFSIKRRRLCGCCGFRFSTIEKLMREEVTVKKRDGHMEEFDRQKIVDSLRAALKKGAYSQERVEALVDEILDNLLTDGKKCLLSAEIGVAVLGVLRGFDELAYLRYLTVHQSFINLEDFKNRILSQGECS